MIHHTKKLIEKKNYMILSIVPQKMYLKKFNYPWLKIKKKQKQKNRNKMHFL